jgi:hypothetical protein
VSEREGGQASVWVTCFAQARADAACRGAASAPSPAPLVPRPHQHLAAAARFRPPPQNANAKLAADPTNSSLQFEVRVWRYGLDAERARLRNCGLETEEFTDEDLVA